MTIGATELQEKIAVARADAALSAGGEPFLFSREIIEALTDAEERGEYTAERFRVQHPDKYQAVITLRGLDWGQKRIAQLLKVHHRTVAAVDDAEPEAIDTVRQRLIRKLRRGSTLLVDLVVENPESVPPPMRGLVASQLIDKAELLDGRATGRVEHTERIRFDDFESFIEQQLPTEKELPAGAVREIGLPGGESPPIAAPIHALQTPGSDRADAGSDDSVRSSEAKAARVTTCGTTTGPEGDPAAGGGVPSTTHPPSRDT